MSGWRTGRPDSPLSAFGIGVVAAVVILDQLAKLAATAWLPRETAIDVLPILALYRVDNTGIAFSFLAGSGAALIVLMIAVSAVVIGFWVAARDGGRLAAAGYALILGGAVGNLIDRLRLGHVVDFLLLHLGNWTLFVFNLADTALTLGPCLLLVAYLFPGRQEAPD